MKIHFSEILPKSWAAAFAAALLNFVFLADNGRAQIAETNASLSGLRGQIDAVVNQPRFSGAVWVSRLPRWIRAALSMKITGIV